MKNEYCDKFEQLVLLIPYKYGFGFTYPPLETARLHGCNTKEVPVFEVRL